MFQPEYPVSLPAPSALAATGSSSAVSSNLQPVTEVSSALAIGSTSGGRKRALSNNRALPAKKMRQTKKSRRGEDGKSGEGNMRSKTGPSILEDRAHRGEITYLSLLPIIRDENGITVQGAASGQFVQCLHDKIQYTSVFLANNCPRMLVVVLDSRVRLRNVIYSKFGTLDKSSFVSYAQQFINLMVDRSAELGQPVELGNKQFVSL